jgi:hypothetical protein
MTAVRAEQAWCKRLKKNGIHNCEKEQGILHQDVFCHSPDASRTKDVRP